MDLQSGATWSRICNPHRICTSAFMAGTIAGDINNAYFLTLTVVDWVDIFTRPAYRHIFTDAQNFAIETKGTEVYVWVLMSNHAHIIASAKGEHPPLPISATVCFLLPFGHRRCLLPRSRPLRGTATGRFCLPLCRVCCSLLPSRLWDCK